MRPEDDAAPALAGWSFLGDRVVVVSPFPPTTDGIGQYAAQLVTALRAEKDVETIALRERGDGDRVMDLRGGVRILRLLRVTDRGQDIVLMWHPHYFVGGNALSRIAVHLSFAALFRLRRVSVVVHEPYPGPRRHGVVVRLGRAVQEVARRICWRSPVRLVFHTRWEADRFTRRFPAPPRRAAELVPHGAFFRARTDLSRAEARARLGLPSGAPVFLSIGFLSPHKGFDRALMAFRDSGGSDAHLYVVGSAMTPSDEVRAHVEELRLLTRDIPRAHLVERYVADDEFDTWIRAADLVLIPYRSAASSGVIERARTLGTPLLISGAGGLAEQAAELATVIRTEAELRHALAEWSRVAA